MSRDPRLRELGAFLRARRGEVLPSTTPGEAGAGRRRVTGLRREEVASLVHITTEYYTRIEQGRMVPARDLVRRLGRILGLDEGELQYALALLDGDDPHAADDGPIDDALLRLLSSFGDIPAFVIGPGTAILWWNAAAVEWFCDFGRVPEPARTFTRMVFTDREFQDKFCDLPQMQATAVGILRAGMPSLLGAGSVAAAPSDLLALPEFRVVWDRHDVVQPRVSIELTLRHPTRGDVRVVLIALGVADEPSRRVLLFSDR